MSKTLLNSAELEMENPERLAQLIIDLSQIMDGAVEDPRKTFSYSLIQRVVTASSEELMALMRDPMRMLPLYYSVVQHVLLQHVEAPDDLEKILDTMESHQRSGTRDNEYLQVVKDTYTRTFNNTRAVYARMEKLSADLDRFEQQSDEQNEEFKEKMDALSVQLEREQRSLRQDRRYVEKVGGVIERGGQGRCGKGSPQKGPNNGWKKHRNPINCCGSGFVYYYYGSDIVYVMVQDG